MSGVAQSRPAFLATARGGHSADPAARCPHCGQPSWLHLVAATNTTDAWFPVQVLVCPEAEVPMHRCAQCGSPPALHAVAGTNLRCTHCGHAWTLPFPAARPPELTHCATCDGRRWITNDVPCTNCNPRGQP